MSCVFYKTLKSLCTMMVSNISRHLMCKSLELPFAICLTATAPVMQEVEIHFISLTVKSIL